MAEYYYTITVRTAQPRVVVDTRTNRADVPIISITLADPHLAEVADSIVQVSLVIEGHDQGWSGFQADQGTTHNSWTWYSIGTNDPVTHEDRLATNLHAVKDTQTHKFLWDRGSDVVRLLKDGNTLEVWAHARYASIIAPSNESCQTVAGRYPGWKNHVERAELSIYSFPL